MNAISKKKIESKNVSGQISAIKDFYMINRSNNYCINLLVVGCQTQTLKELKYGGSVIKGREQASKKKQPWITEDTLLIMDHVDKQNIVVIRKNIGY